VSNFSFVKKTKEVFDLAEPRKRWLVYAVVCSALASVAQLFGLGLIVPVLNGLVDSGSYSALLGSSKLGELIELLPIEKNNQNVFLVIVSLILISVILENVLVYFGQRNFSKIVTSINHNLRVKVFERFLGFSKKFHDTQKVGELNTLITTVVTAVGQHFHTIGLAFIALMFSLAFLTMMLIISWRLTLMSFVILPIVGLVSRSLVKKIRKSASREVDSLLNLSHKSLDILNNTDLVHMSSSEVAEVARLKDMSEQVRHHGLSTRVRSHLVPRLVDVVNSTGIVVLGCVAVFLFTSVEASSIGRLSVFFISLRRLSSHVEQLTGYLTNLVSGVANLERVSWVFEDSDKSFIESGSKECSSINKGIEFKDIHFSYGQTPILNGVSLSVPVNSTFAIVGETGSGKSTLLKLLTRLYEANSGTIKIDDVEIKEFNLSSYRSKLSLVSQSAVVLNATIRENISYGIQASQADIEAAAKEAYIHDFIMELPQGYETIVGGNGVRLSGGERQRLSIARAFLRNPSILLLDEPTSALDASTEYAVQEALAKLRDSRTVIVVAHRLSTIQTADSIVVLEDGVVKEQGAAEELMKIKGKFFEYAELQKIFK